MVLFLQANAIADTVLVRQVPAVRTAFEQVVFVVGGITSILTLLAVLVVLAMLLALRSVGKELHRKLEEVLIELRPLTMNANMAAQDVRQVAAAAREMAEESRETVSLANERVRDTVDNLAERVDDLAEMLGRVYDTGQRVAAVTSTAVGGLKAGARFLGFGRGKKKRKKRSASVSSRRNGPRLRQRS
ncbi:MAG: hypothetical protein KF709_14090 [Gemmatimonadaceae bacterium]|nr:hypothetical protein [Gemmatimonadaceae bacterium]